MQNGCAGGRWLHLIVLFGQSGALVHILRPLFNKHRVARSFGVSGACVWIVVHGIETRQTALCGASLFVAPGVWISGVFQRNEEVGQGPQARRPDLLVSDPEQAAKEEAWPARIIPVALGACVIEGTPRPVLRF